MSTGFDVLDRLYPCLNVATVTATIDGRVYRRKRPHNSVKRDIVIIPYSLRDGEGLDVQPGIVFINCFAKNKASGFVDRTNLKSTTDAVITQLGRFAQGSTYMNLEVVSESTFDDVDREDWSYSSIRVRVIIE